jgi:hypothetical protein
MSMASVCSLLFFVPKYAETFHTIPVHTALCFYAGKDMRDRILPPLGNQFKKSPSTRPEALTRNNACENANLFHGCGFSCDPPG